MHVVNYHGIAMTHGTGRNVKTHLSTVGTYWPTVCFNSQNVWQKQRWEPEVFLSQASPPLLGSGLDGLSYHHYFRVTYGPLPTIKCFGIFLALPSLLAPLRVT